MLNMKFMQELHKKYCTRPDRKSNFAKSTDFILDDAISMFDDSEADITNSEIKMVFPLSKQQVVVNDADEAGS